MIFILEIAAGILAYVKRDKVTTGQYAKYTYKTFNIGF